MDASTSQRRRIKNDKIKNIIIIIGCLLFSSLLLVGSFSFGICYKSGDVNCSGYLEHTFLYEDGVLFREGLKDWQWRLDQTGGKCMETMASAKFITGQQYKLMIRYEGMSIKAFFNDQLIYENKEVISPKTSASVAGDCEGYRRFLKNLNVLSMCSSNVGSVSVYAKLKEKWKNQLVSDEYDETNEPVVNYVQNLSNESKKLYQALYKNPNRSYLWPMDKGSRLSSHLTTQFKKLQKLTLAYGTNGSTFYQDSKIAAAIEDGLDFFVTKKGYDGRKYKGNWWDWQIGVPKKFVEILMILGDQIPQAKIKQYTAAMSSYVPDTIKQLHSTSEATGANRMDLALTVLALGILQENETKIIEASRSILDVSKIVTNGDGFYLDGSYIFHARIPYTGAYGNDLLRAAGQILMITQDSKSRFEIERENVQSFAEGVYHAFIPLIYKGETLPLVKGRQYSRAPDKTNYSFDAILYNLHILSNFTSGVYRTKFKEAVKYWMQENPTYYLTNSRDYNDLQMTMSLLNDASIVGNTLPFVGTKMYASMDRFVQSTPNYMLGLSMYSSRISSFSTGNKENKRGWHTADGMMYLYNGDEVQFNATYWPTIDPYRLPGTTVDTVQLTEEMSAWESRTSEEKWVGGVQLEDQAVVGMALNKAGTKSNGILLPMDLQGKKSWFMVDGQIIALGAGIKGKTLASIETIVDNRLLNDNYKYQVVSNNGIIQMNNNETRSKEWLLLKSDHQNANIGYYFPEKATVNVISETREGTYAQINERWNGNGVYYKGNYRKFVIDHGKNPMNEQYAYVTLPCITEADLKLYAREKPVTILANSADIQAVELKKSNYLGVNMWSVTGGSIAGITSDRAVSLLRRTKEGKKTYVLSDPTQSNAVMKVKLPKDFNKILSLSEGIKYNETAEIFTISFENSDGRSKQIIVQ